MKRAIKAIQFGLFDPKLIESYSVCEVKSGLDILNDGVSPKEGSLNDIRMGPVISGARTVLRCLTDNEENDKCPGFFGHIKLVYPLYHIGLVRTMVRVLTCVSYRDSSLLIDHDTKCRISARRLSNNGERILKTIEMASKDIERCRQTGHVQPIFHLSITATNGIRIIMDFSRARKRRENKEKSLEETTQELSPLEALNILKKISDDEIHVLGFNSKYSRPEWMVITVLPVPPPSVRPAAFSNETSRAEDDLSTMLSDIISDNNDLRRLTENDTADHILQATISRIQTRVSSYFDNNLSGHGKIQNRGKDIKSIQDRISGKYGRIRGNLMGKRVDFSARTVITGDANIALDELGIPTSISRNLTYPELVTSQNREKIIEIVKAKAFKKIIRKKGSETRSYFKVIDENRIEVGDVVERHLRDGDVVLFNRQPSLHKMSTMGHKIRILPYSTFRLNHSATTPYNADFDGDEMNMHVPQSYETRAETKSLMMVPLNIVSPQMCKPVIGIVQDSLLGSSLITRRDILISKSDFMNICMCVEEFTGNLPTPSLLKPNCKWTGKQLFNILIPKINLRNKSGETETGDDPYFSVTDSYINISNGELISGILCKKTLGQNSGGLIHLVWMEYGSNAACRLITNIQRCVNHWLLLQGMSVGIGDATVDKVTIKKIKEVISTQKKEVEKILYRFQRREVEAEPGLSLEQTLEKIINQVLNKAREDTGEMVQRSLSHCNNLKRMVTSGSKGNNNNISQVIACVAQQNIEGSRIGFGFLNRSLPHYARGDFGAEPKGFVRNSYLSGLSPQEFFFHAMGGREGLIDTAIKTADSGYISRKLVKALEDIKVHYDGTVRNSEGDVIQFIYGEDGFDGTSLELQHFDHIKMDIENLEETYKYDESTLTSLVSNVEDENIIKKSKVEIVKEKVGREYEIILNQLRDLKENFIPPSKVDDLLTLPVHMKRLISNCHKSFAREYSIKIHSRINPISVIEKIEELVESLHVVPGAHIYPSETQNDNITMFNYFVRSNLSSKRVLTEYKLSSKAFSWLLQEIKKRFYLALVNPGEMIGTLAAQSLGEPTTQMTLNTFHSAGIGAKNVTLGIPRMKEILNASELRTLPNIKTPSLTIFLKKDISNSKLRSKKVASSIEHTVIKKILSSIQLWYDPDLLHTFIPEDQSLIDLYKLELLTDRESTFSPWIIRLELDKTVCLDKELLSKDIADRLENEIGSLARILYQPFNADYQVIRIRLILENQNDDNATSIQTYKHSMQSISNYYLKGVKNIRRSMISKTKMAVISKKSYCESEPANRMYADWPESKILPEIWVLHTEGANMQGVMCFGNEINHKKVYSNDIVEVRRILGIEASRCTLFQELKRIVEFDGSGVDYRHLALLIEMMTFQGKITPVNRHGISCHASGPLAHCSFEKPLDILTRAAIFAEKDKLSGISDKLIVGQLLKIGTASFDLLFDEQIGNLKGKLAINQLINYPKISHRNNLMLERVCKIIEISKRGDTKFLFEFCDKKLEKYQVSYTNKYF
eukprot:gnl/TRDRNA2_/TRDRNA2_178045_c0_seq8.p1 gnl/TRDRNA2_/TRDRNA2_178045_c0~~gnl/TRDRNA2_/TRDRNA2_178045_c0_seq8.p1  ORF type:complete len:1521 (-),score=-42.62 gnl/TRDRNA2_/TRDRNA2_178045_c0_seq8:230-4792(-)